VTSTDFFSLLKAFGLRNRAEAQDQRSKANQVRTEAETYAAQHVGEAMAPSRQRILDDAKVQAEQHLTDAEQKEERAAAAEAGYLLCRNSIEARNLSWATENQELIAAAGELGLLKDYLPASQAGDWV
jgi:hypothetical protein